MSAMYGRGSTRAAPLGAPGTECCCPETCMADVVFWGPRALWRRLERATAAKDMHFRKTRLDASASLSETGARIVLSSRIDLMNFRPLVTDHGPPTPAREMPPADTDHQLIHGRLALIDYTLPGRFHTHGLLFSTPQPEVELYSDTGCDSSMGVKNRSETPDSWFTAPSCRSQCPTGSLLDTSEIHPCGFQNMALAPMMIMARPPWHDLASKDCSSGLGPRRCLQNGAANLSVESTLPIRSYSQTYETSLDGMLINNQASGHHSMTRGRSLDRRQIEHPQSSMLSRYYQQRLNARKMTGSRSPSSEYDSVLLSQPSTPSYPSQAETQVESSGISQYTTSDATSPSVLCSCYPGDDEPCAACGLSAVWDSQDKTIMDSSGDQACAASVTPGLGLPGVDDEQNPSLLPLSVEPFLLML